MNHVPSCDDNLDYVALSEFGLSFFFLLPFPVRFGFLSIRFYLFGLIHTRSSTLHGSSLPILNREQPITN